MFVAFCLRSNNTLTEELIQGPPDQSPVDGPAGQTDPGEFSAALVAVIAAINSFYPFVEVRSSRAYDFFLNANAVLAQPLISEEALIVRTLSRSPPARRRAADWLLGPHESC